MEAYVALGRACTLVPPMPGSALGGCQLSGGSPDDISRPKGVTGAAALKQPSARSGACAHRHKPRVIAESKKSKILTVVSVMQPRFNAKPLIFIGIQTPGGGPNLANFTVLINLLKDHS